MDSDSGGSDSPATGAGSSPNTMSSNSSTNAVLIAVIGLFSTVAGGVFANWDKIFPPAPDPAALIQQEPTDAGAPQEQAKDEGAEDAASEPAH